MDKQFVHTTEAIHILTKIEHTGIINSVKLVDRLIAEEEPTTPMAFAANILETVAGEVSISQADHSQSACCCRCWGFIKEHSWFGIGFVQLSQTVQIENIECYFMGVLSIGFVLGRSASFSPYPGLPAPPSSHSQLECR